MYIENGVEKLSKAQVSKLLNGHRVRVKKGQGAKIHLTEEHSKKLHKAHMKGSGTTIQLDPYAIASNQHLRQAVAGAVKQAVKHLMGGTALIDQPFTTRQAVNTIGNFVKDPKGTVGFGAHGGTLLIDQPFTARQAVNTIGNFVNDPKGTVGFGLKRRGRPPKAMTGSGPKGLKKFQKWTGAIGDFFKPVAKPILEAATNQAVNNINAYGEANATQANPYGTFMDALGGQGLPKHRGRPRKVYSESPKVHHKKKAGRPKKKGGAALPPGTPYGMYGNAEVLQTSR